MTKYHLSGSTLITNGLINLPESSCELIHLNGVLQSVPQKVVVMSNLEYKHMLFFSCHISMTTLCMSSLMMTWRPTAFSNSSLGKGEGKSMKGAKWRASLSK